MGRAERAETGPAPGGGAVVSYCSGEADFDGFPGDELLPLEVVKQKHQKDAPAPPERFAD
jgi:hypothetical protein